MRALLFIALVACSDPSLEDITADTNEPTFCEAGAWPVAGGTHYTTCPRVCQTRPPLVPVGERRCYNAFGEKLTSAHIVTVEGYVGHCAVARVDGEERIVWGACACGDEDKP